MENALGCKNLQSDGSHGTREGQWAASKQVNALVFLFTHQQVLTQILSRDSQHRVGVSEVYVCVNVCGGPTFQRPLRAHNVVRKWV